MGRSSRNKGKRGEREAAQEIQRLLGVQARRGCQYRGGPDSPDILTTLPGIHWEVKRTERLRIYEAMQQAAQEAPEGAVPVVLYRANRRPWLVILYLEDFSKAMHYASPSGPGDCSPPGLDIIPSGGL